MGRSLSRRALRKTWKARLALWSGSRTLRRSRRSSRQARLGSFAKDLRSRATEPVQIIIGHPFNPPFYPLAEIAGGEDAPEPAASAAEFYKATGAR